MKNAFLAIGFFVSIALSLFVGYKKGIEDGFQHTEKVNDVDHATGLMRSRFDSAFENYACYLKLREAEKDDDIAGVKNDVKDSALHSINGFRDQVDRIRSANINYPLVDIYEPQINSMEAELVQ